MTFDPHKPARTRDGRPAKFLRDCNDETYPYCFEVAGSGARPPYQITTTIHGIYIGKGYQSYLDLENYDPVPQPSASVFDPTKPVQTRDGRKARIICTDRAAKASLYAKYPIVALVEDGEGNEHAREFTETGASNVRYPHGTGNDLVNIPEEHSCWTLVWQGVVSDDHHFVHYDTEDQAKNAAKGMIARGSRVIAIFPTAYKEGEGVTPAS